MKLVCTQENLRQALAIATKIVSATNTLPILNNLLLKAAGGQLNISSTNLELAINTSARCKIEKEGQTTVAAKTLSEVVNNLPNENLVLTEENRTLEIKTENQNFKIRTTSPEEFPFIPKKQEGKTVTIRPEELKEAINAVAFVASTNQTQPEITGVFLSLKPEGGRLVATDRYRLAEKSIACVGSAEVILPQKTAVEVARILSLTPEETEISISENQIFFTIGQTEIVSRLVDGQYPDYKSIIPENFTTILTIERERLQNALKTNAPFSQNSGSVRVTFAKDRLTITSETEGLGSGEATVPASQTGEAGGLLLNFRYVLDFLSQTREKNVVIKVVNDSSPVVFAPEGQTGYLYLVMPIKT